MPKYIDRHPFAPIPQQVLDQVKANLGKPDQFGVTGINMFVSKEFIQCYSEAPGPENIHKEHEAIGINLGPGDVQEVTTLV
jgi:hypothetical protein